MAGTAFDSNAVSLAEFAIASNDPVVESVTLSLYETSNFLQDLKVITYPSMKKKGVRYTNLNGTAATPGWRRLGEVPTVTKSRGTPFEEQVFILSNQFQIDSVQKMDVNNIGDPMKEQLDVYLKDVQYECNQRFLTNDPTGANGGDPDAPAGLLYRLDNPSTYGIPTEMKMNGIEGTGTVITATQTMTALNANLFLMSIQAILDAMGSPSGENVVCYCNDYGKRHLEMAVRLMGGGAGFDTTKDDFDRSIESYKQMKIRDIGRRIDQTTRILAPENANGTPHATTTFGTAGQCTSMYFVKHLTGYFTGWQMKPLKPKYLGEDPTNGVTENANLDWPVGLFMQNNRSIARLFGIQLF